MPALFCLRTKLFLPDAARLVTRIDVDCNVLNVVLIGQLRWHPTDCDRIISIFVLELLKSLLYLAVRPTGLDRRHGAIAVIVRGRYSWSGDCRGRHSTLNTPH